MHNKYLLLIIIPLLYTLIGCNEKMPDELPNILWITSEDNSPFLGCYGDTFATTPNLDKLASEGFLYTHAYANAPVCSPARNTIITGIYANSGGNQNMQSFYKKSDLIKLYPQYLREAGYYCTNNHKTDYNIDPIQTQGIWDECGVKAHYKNRHPGQPFFAVFNSEISHESRIHTSIPNDKLRHSPEEVSLPPYHPATPEMKHDWAQYYDKVEDMDAWVGSLLKELKGSGLYNNTIVIYYADHGGVLARSKRYVYETGTRVPLIIRIPEKYKYLFPSRYAGEKVNRLVSFVDLAPTLLSIIGTKIPDFMQGNAFLGQQKMEAPEYAYMFRGRMDERYDMCRAVRGKKYRYIHNYMPYRIYGQHLNYLWLAPSIRSWEQAYLEGKCNDIQSIFWNKKPAEELFDTENDPWEVDNLAGDPQYNDVLIRMRNANKEWVTRIYDTGFIPEEDLAIRAGDTPYYDYMRSGEVPLNEIIEAADVATLENEGKLEKCISYLKDGDSAIRYWGATGLLMLGDKANDGIPDLVNLLNDTFPDVVAVAAEALFNLGKKEEALKAFFKLLDHPDEKVRCRALNAINCIDVNDKELQGKVFQLVTRSGQEDRDNYDIRAASWLLQKWGINYGMNQ